MTNGLSLPLLLNNTTPLMYNILMARKPMYTPEEKKLKQAEWVANWRRNNPEKQKLARQRAYDNRKRKAMELVGGVVCVRCGCKELHALEFNHMNGGGASEHRQNNNTPIVDRILTLKRTTDDLEILCRVCNSLDHLERKLPHIVGRYKVVYNNQLPENWEELTPAINSVEKA
jgi:hypothetical protein